MEKSCDNCIHFKVCKTRIEQFNNMEFVDFDKPRVSDWIKKIWELLAERCIYFKKKDKK